MADNQPKKRRKRLPKKKVARIRELVASGRRTIAEVAEAYGIPYFTAYSITRGYSYTRAPGPKAPRQRKFMSEALRDRILALRAKGATISQLVGATKFSESTIKRALRQARSEQ